MGRPILYAHLIWNNFTAAFLRYGTLFDLEDYKDTISNKYKKWIVRSYMGRPILYAHLIWDVPYYHTQFLRINITPNRNRKSPTHFHEIVLDNN